jgi:hypothetical protein
MHQFYESRGFTWIGPEIDQGVGEELQRSVANEVLSQAQQLLLHGAIRFDQNFEIISSSQLLRYIDDDRLVQVTLHPAFRYLLRALRRITADNEAESWLHYARHAIDFVWPELAARKRLSGPLTAYTDRNGGLRCVTRGLFVELGEAYANQRVELIPSESDVTGICQDGLTFVIPYADFAGSEMKNPQALNNMATHLPVFLQSPTAEFRFLQGTLG